MEDDKISVMAVQRLIRRKAPGLECHVAGDGLEALQMLLGTPDLPPMPRPDLIVVDLSMPRMNGFEFLQSIAESERAEAQNLRIVVWSCSMMPDDRDRSLRLGAERYLVKGEDMKPLLELFAMLGR